MSTETPSLPRYCIRVVQSDRLDDQEKLADKLSTHLRTLGLQAVIALDVVDDVPENRPCVTVFLGSSAAGTDRHCAEAANKTLEAGHVVLPVLSPDDNPVDCLPPCLRPINATRWSPAESAEGVVHLVFEELGIHDRKRMAFISYRRVDGLLAADQAFEHLSARRFVAFLDRHSVPPGADFQRRIADSLEDYAFLLLLETPQAHQSQWVYDELSYAMTHSLGIHIVRWPGDFDEIPGSNRLPRQILSSSDLMDANGYAGLTPSAWNRVMDEVERAHADSLVRRRRMIVQSTIEAAAAKGLECTPLPQWNIIVHGADGDEVLAIAPRLPRVEDLRRVDVLRETAGTPQTEAIVVHAARSLTEGRRALLEWAAADRPIVLIPENAIGGYW